MTRSLLTGAFAMVNIQALLGITTLLYLVPVPLAAGHQAGSVALFTVLLHILVSLRRPGAAARPNTSPMCSIISRNWWSRRSMAPEATGC